MNDNQQRRQKRGDRPTGPLTGWPEDFGAGATAAAEAAQPASVDVCPAATSGPVQEKVYGPDNPPRLRKEGESVGDYRIAMGWDEPKVESPATASGDDLPPTVKRWEDRFNDLSGPDTVRAAMEAEIADLRATVSAATKPTADANELTFNATRLRNVARLVGLEKSIPEDDAMLDGARGSVLGLIAGALRNAATLPRWIDNLKGSDPTIDGLIEYIIKQQSLLATKPAPQAFLAAELPAAEPVYRASDIATKPAAPAVPEKLTRSMCATKDYCQGWNDCVDEALKGSGGASTDAVIEAREQALIQSVPVQRDSIGAWTHPGMPEFDEGDADKYHAWIEAQGLEVKVHWLENESEEDLAYRAYFEEECGHFRNWESAAPGEGWFTLSIDDTEDGPAWWWARRTQAAGAEGAE